jgi:predicted nucleic acid-binding protein
MVELLLDSPRGERVRSRLSETVHAPHLLDLEVAQSLRRYERLGQIAPERLIERYPHDPLLPRIWALRSNATAYDAAYLALAEALDATLLTADNKMTSVPGHRARVEVVR